MKSLCVSVGQNVGGGPYHEENDSDKSAALSEANKDEVCKNK